MTHAGCFLVVAILTMSTVAFSSDTADSRATLRGLVEVGLTETTKNLFVALCVLGVFVVIHNAKVIFISPWDSQAVWKP